MSAKYNSYRKAPSHMKTEAARRPRKASFVVAAALVAALGGVGGAFLATNAGNTQQAPVAKTQVVAADNAASNTTTAPVAKTTTAPAATTAAPVKAASNETPAQQTPSKQAPAIQQQAQQQVNETAQKSTYQAKHFANPEAKYTPGKCCEIALSVFDPEGTAANVKTSDLIFGGGANYYNVEFDKDGAHYNVQVNADDGVIVSGSSVCGNREVVYDGNGVACCAVVDGDEPSPLTAAEQEKSADSTAATPEAETPVAKAAEVEEAKYTPGKCSEIALSVFDPEGTAANVTVSGITQGGGASTCYVEFDKGGQHYTVRVNADEGTIVYGSSTDGVHETTYDGNGYALTTIDM